jgi:uncharacterized RDD family membrane protein YckC
MTDPGDLLTIDTPENIAFDYKIAGIGSRFLAALVDTALIVLLQVVLFGAVLLIVNLVADSLAGVVASWLFAIAGIVGFLFFWGYYIFFEILWNGQTPGKRQVGLRVIRVDGTPATAGEVVIRNLVRIIDFLPVAYGVGVVTMFINASSRRAGDLAAGTLVVHDRALKDLNDLMPARPIMQVREGGQGGILPEGFPVERVSEYELHIIEEFLSRRASLENRAILARHILASVLTRLSLPPGALDAAQAEPILAEIYAARRSAGVAPKPE